MPPPPHTLTVQLDLCTKEGNFSFFMKTVPRVPQPERDYWTPRFPDVGSQTPVVCDSDPHLSFSMSLEVPAVPRLSLSLQLDLVSLEPLS